MSTELARRDAHQFLIQAVLDSLTSVHTQRAYARALRDFFAWHDTQGQPDLSRVTVQGYVNALRRSGMGASSINQRLSAINKFVEQAASRGATVDVGGIAAVKGVKLAGRRAGNWLTVSKATQLLRAPDVSTLRGLRDHAMLTVLVGCGLRRAELVKLDAAQIQEREERWAIINLVGKREKMRSIPMSDWTKDALDEWMRVALADSASGQVFRLVHKSGSLRAEGISEQVVYEVVKEYGEAIGVEALAPHDLRRTFARLAFLGGSPLEQIKESLGHSSVQTTERYIGSMQNFRDAPADHLGITL